MISGLYSAATAMDAAAVRHETSAENLAHAHKPGYRRRVVHQSTFGSLLRPQAARSGGVSPTLGTTAGTEVNRQIRVDFSTGPVKQTGRSLDVALEGDGFFVVEGPDGPLYSRNGSFQSHPDGSLVTVDGLAVIGTNGPIRIPADTPAEAIDISRDGRLSVDGFEFDQLQIVDVPDKAALIAVGASLFHAPEGTETGPTNSNVLQGYVEAANVAHMDELVNILVASRQYEAAQKALKTIDESLSRHINGN
ncbi:MAG: flagellar hook-basal body protein [Fuerstiella sp.]